MVPQRSRNSDYDIWHNDLWVTIEPNAMAGFYKIGTHDVIDHAPQVLGLDANGRRRVQSKATMVGARPQKAARRGR